MQVVYKEAACILSTTQVQQRLNEGDMPGQYRSVAYPGFHFGGYKKVK